MSSFFLLSALLAAPPGDGEVPKPPAVSENQSKSQTEKPTAPTLETVREDYLSAMQKSARREKPKLPKVVPDLVAVYGALKDVEGISHKERSRMRGVVKARLEEFRGKLIRELLRNKKLADRQKRRQTPRSNSQPVDEKAEMLAGGGANAQAIQLIDLIQNTIEPESWQAVGGKGSIYYFDLLKVLVVRQTGEVHHQLGGLLPKLRP